MVEWEGGGNKGERDMHKLVVVAVMLSRSEGRGELGARRAFVEAVCVGIRKETGESEQETVHKEFVQFLWAWAAVDAVDSGSTKHEQVKGQHRHRLNSIASFEIIYGRVPTSCCWPFDVFAGSIHQ